MSQKVEEVTLRNLTAKQREVLDLMFGQMTSKEIASQLGLSHHTVDQRIGIAKQKLGASSRSDLVSRYRALLSAEAGISGKSVYQNPDMAQEAALPAEEFPENTSTEQPSGPVPTDLQEPSAARSNIRVVPEIFDGRHGTFYRLAALITLVAIILLIGLIGLALFGQLSELIAS